VNVTIETKAIDKWADGYWTRCKLVVVDGGNDGRKMGNL
jgi:hypothetical protein